MLAKSLRPPPDKHHGLGDVETRFRRRELDLIANEEVRDRFIARAKIVAAVRRSLDDAGFVEVETPVLQPLYGGALARPFTTHHNALDRELYLRIATELYLKRCIVGGLERVYELGKDFRNEGLSPKHNPEFTMLEFYEAYADYEDTGRRLEAIVVAAAEAVPGYDGPDLTPPWKRVTLREAILDKTGFDVIEHRDRDALVAAIAERGLDLPTDDDTWAQLVDDLLSKHVEPKLVEPTFVVDYPVELSPFAKAHRSEPGLVERLGGVRRRDGDRQRLHGAQRPRRAAPRFEAQKRHAAEGDDEAQPYDEIYVQALEHGMPPTGGCGLGHRPPGHAPDRAALDPRGRALPGDARALMTARTSRSRPGSGVNPHDSALPKGLPTPRPTAPVLIDWRMRASAPDRSSISDARPTR